MVPNLFGSAASFAAPRRISDTSFSNRGCIFSLIAFCKFNLFHVLVLVRKRVENPLGLVVELLSRVLIALRNPKMEPQNYCMRVLTAQGRVLPGGGWELREMMRVRYLCCSLSYSDLGNLLCEKVS